MARNSWHGSLLAAVAIASSVAAAVELSAHRRDEYLQAARIAIEPERVQIQLDLTAGIALADAVLAEIDRDRSGTISEAEGAAYVAIVRSAITLEVDGAPLSLELMESRFPPIDAIRKGEGAIRIDFAALIPNLPAGPHHLRYRNDHRAGLSVYLANMLVPLSNRLVLGAQRRDVDQRELIVEYSLD